MNKLKNFPRKSMYPNETGTKISAAILAGGKSKRLGGMDKAFIQIRGKPIVRSILDVLKGEFEEIIIVANEHGAYDSFKHKATLVSDTIKGKGPLGGIHSALANTAADAVFVVACDMPFLNSGLIEREIEKFREIRADALVPARGPYIEPLHAIYRTDIKEKLYEHLVRTTDLSIRVFLNTVNTHYWDISGLSGGEAFINVNSQDDLKGLEKN